MALLWVSHLLGAKKTPRDKNQKPQRFGAPQVAWELERHPGVDGNPGGDFTQGRFPSMF